MEIYATFIIFLTLMVLQSMIISSRKQPSWNTLHLKMFWSKCAEQVEEQSSPKKIFRTLSGIFQLHGASCHQWLLGPQRRDEFYQETCLSFGLCISPYLFNLLGEGFQWMLIFYLNWAESEHDLDDFILILEALSATPAKLEWHKKITDPSPTTLEIHVKKPKTLPERWSQYLALKPTQIFL